MGLLTEALNVRAVIETYDIENFVETGTHEGHTLNAMMQYGLNNYSVEVDPGLVESANSRFGDRATVMCGFTKDVFPDLLKQVSDAPTLFWLDAHFPWSEVKGDLRPYDSESDNTKRVPAETELRMICEHRDPSKDVIVIDDLRIYVDRPENAVWNMRKTAGADGYWFVHECLSTTHTIYEYLDQQGYIICMPRHVHHFNPGYMMSYVRHFNLLSQEPDPW